MIAIVAPQMLTRINMQLNELKDIIVDSLEGLKAVDTKILDVTEIASFTDLMIIASGTSTRQVKALADKVIEKSKQAGVRPIGVEGEREAEWILVDLGDIVVHIMNPEIRTFYNLEKLWARHEKTGGSSAASH